MSVSKTFAIHLNNEEAAIVTITSTGNVHDLDKQITVLDSNGYLIANIRLAMDATKRIVHETRKDLGQ